MEMILRIKWFVYLLFADTLKKIRFYISGIWLKAWKRAIDEKYGRLKK